MICLWVVRWKQGILSKKTDVEPPFKLLSWDDQKGCLAESGIWFYGARETVHVVWYGA